MDLSFIAGQCTNCATTLTSASEIFSKITVVDEDNELKILEIAVLDAILYIYGFSATNLASAYLDNGKESKISSFDKITETSECLVKNGLLLCGNCVNPFRELYFAYRQLKKLSNRAALLTKAIKKFSPTSIKIEIEQEKNKRTVGNAENNGINTRRYGPKSFKSNKKAPLTNAGDTEEVENSSEDLFQAFNFEEDCGDEENDPKELKPEIFSEIKNANSFLLVPSITSFENTVSVSHEIRIRECSVHLKRLTKLNSDSLEVSERDYMKIFDPNSFCDNPVLPPKHKSYRRRRKVKTENEVTEPFERRRRVKKILTEKQKEKSMFTLKATMKKYKERIRLKQKKCWKGRVKNKNIENVPRVQKSIPHLCLVNKVDSQENNEISSQEYGNNNEHEQPSHSSTSKEHDERMKMLICYCGKSYTTLLSLKHHEKSSHTAEPPVSVACDSCEESFDSCYALYVHKSLDHSQLQHILFNCNVCNARYITKRQLQDHQELKHGIVKEKFCERKILKCGCGKSLISLAGLRRHEKKECHPEGSVVCDVCGETFKKFYLLYGHKSIAHSELPEITFQCTVCDVKYINKHHLSIHEQQHHHPESQRSFICDKCGAGFSCLKYLKKHARGIHSDEGKDKEQFRCKECGILLKHSQGLKKHTREMHHRQITYVCEQCGKTTKNRTNMRIHMKVHDPNRTVKEKLPLLPTQKPITASVMNFSQLGYLAKM